MFKNTATKLIVYAWDSTTNLPKTGDAANLTAYVDVDFGGVTVLADTSATELDNANAKGFYTFDLAQGETNGDTLLFTAKSATSNVVVLAMPAVVFTLPATGILAPVTAGRTLDVDTAHKAPVTVAAGDIATDAITAAAVKADAVTKIQAGLAVPGSAMTLTAAYDAAKTAAQPSDVPSAAAVATAVAASLASAHGGGSWVTATGFAVPGDPMDVASVNGITVTGSGTTLDPWGPA